MRIALISDIHGNHWALAAMLEHIGRQYVEAIWNLGDILLTPAELPPGEVTEDHGRASCQPGPACLRHMHGHASRTSVSPSHAR